MKTVSWIAGLLGIIVALVGVFFKVSGAVTVNILGRHAPSTFLILGILLLVFGVWVAVLGLGEKK